jgi:hypothetical protein
MLLVTGSQSKNVSNTKIIGTKMSSLMHFSPFRGKGDSISPYLPISDFCIYPHSDIPQGLKGLILEMNPLRQLWFKQSCLLVRIWRTMYAKTTFLYALRFWLTIVRINFCLNTFLCRPYSTHVRLLHRIPTTEGGGETVTYPKQRALQNVIQASVCQGPT